MTPIIIGIAVVLILAILVLIFRIQTLVSVMKGTYTQRAGLSNKINAAMFLIFFFVGMAGFYWITDYARQFYLPRAASLNGVATDNLFLITMIILIAAFVVTNIFLFAFAFRYQYQEGKKAYFYPENHKLEVVWTVIPAIVMTILVYYGWREWAAITKAEPNNSEVVEIMAKQFAWQVRYPGKDGKLGNYNFKLIDASNEFGIDFNDKGSYDDFLPSELHVPKGMPVVLKIRARDVLHSVYAPHFRLKMDAVPGMPTKFWFVPTISTQEMRDELGNPEFNYEIACAEVCGRGHFAMRYIIVVDEPEDFEKWKASQKTFAEVNKEYVLTKAPENLKYLLTPQEATADSTAAPMENTMPKDSANKDLHASLQ